MLLISQKILEAKNVGVSLAEHWPAVGFQFYINFYFRNCFQLLSFVIFLSFQEIWRKFKDIFKDQYSVHPIRL
jgi:hypothetical protein